MATQKQHELFAALVEIVAHNQELTDEWWAGYELILTDVVTDAGGTMDDEQFVDKCAEMLDASINKKAQARRDFLMTQAA